MHNCRNSFFCMSRYGNLSLWLRCWMYKKCTAGLLRENVEYAYYSQWIVWLASRSSCLLHRKTRLLDSPLANWKQAKVPHSFYNHLLLYINGVIDFAWHLEDVDVLYHLHQQGQLSSGASSSYIGPLVLISNGNDIQTKVEKSFDLGFVFDIEEKRTCLFQNL